MISIAKHSRFLFLLPLLLLNRVSKLFRRYDEDGSDSVDGDELYSLLRDLGHLCTREEVLKILKSQFDSV
jgi:Ca2+-binding EF-hand superfamily protein